MLIAEFGNRADNMIQLLSSIIVFAVILFVAYIVTKWIGNYQHVKMKNNNIEVVETVRIMNGKCIQIVRVAEEYFVIAVCKDTVIFLTKLDENSVEQVKNTVTVSDESFQDVLDKLNFKKK